MNEPRKPTPPPAPPPPDDAEPSRPAQGIDRVEFRRGLNDLHRQVAKEAANTRQFIGWLLATVGLLAVLLGLYCMYSKDGGWS